jgi:hypothetical protein
VHTQFPASTSKPGIWRRHTDQLCNRQSLFLYTDLVGWQWSESTLNLPVVSVKITDLEHLIPDTAPYLRLMVQELAAELFSSDNESLGMETDRHDWLSLDSERALLRRVTAQATRIEDVKDSLNATAIRPKLRSTSGWWYKRGGSRDLREEYGQRELSLERKKNHVNGATAVLEGGSERVQQAIKRFRDAARALSERNEAERGAFDANADQNGIRESTTGAANPDERMNKTRDMSTSGPALNYVEDLRSVNGHFRDCLSSFSCPRNKPTASKASEEIIRNHLPSTSSGEALVAPTPEPNPIPVRIDTPQVAGSSSAQSEGEPPGRQSRMGIIDIIEPSFSSGATRRRNYYRPLSHATSPSIITTTDPSSASRDGVDISSSADPGCQVFRRPDTPYPYHRGFHSSYAEATHLQHSRHYACTIRQREMTELCRSGIDSQAAGHPASHLAMPTVPSINPTNMNEYWRTQVQLLKKHDTSRKRRPIRPAPPPSPCSSCSSCSSPIETLARTTPSRPPPPVTPLFRRGYRKLYGVLSRLSRPRTWLDHRSEQFVLIKYPRALSQSYSRSKEWITKDEEVQRVLFRGEGG